MSKIPRILPILEQLREFAAHIGRNILLSPKLEELGAYRVKLIVPTRWYSTSLCLNSILDMKDVLGTLASEEKYGWNKWKDTYLSQAFWAALVDLKPFFDRISSFIGLVEAKDSKLSDGFRAYLELGRYLVKELPHEKTFRREAFESYVLYFNKLDLKLMLAAYIMDPNHKMEYLTEEALDEGFTFIFGMVLSHGSKPEVFREVESEFALYQRAVIEDEGFIQDVYSWWSNQASYHYIKRVGKRVSLMHASSANTERIFSTLSRTLTHSRNRLDLGTVFDILNCQLSDPSFRNQKKVSRARASTSSQMSVDGEQNNEVDEEADFEEDLPSILNDASENQGDTLIEAYFEKFENFINFSSETMTRVSSPRR